MTTPNKSLKVGFKKIYSSALNEDFKGPSTIS